MQNFFFKNYLRYYANKRVGIGTLNRSAILKITLYFKIQTFLFDKQTNIHIALLILKFKGTEMGRYIINSWKRFESLYAERNYEKDCYNIINVCYDL